MATESAAAKAARQALRLIWEKRILRYYAAGICGLMAVFILAHWLRILFIKLRPSSKNPIRSISRLMRSVFVRKVPGFTSSGHAVVVVVYVVINIALTFTNMDITLSNMANRCGWLTMVNFVFVVFLALKNTPLAFLTAYSHERLNILHQIAGATTFLYLFLHACMYTNYFLAAGRGQEIFSEDLNIAGIVAGFAFLGLIVSGVVLRSRWYEAFLAVHIPCFIVAVITAGYHQPNLAKKGLLIGPIVMAVIWGTDRLIRGTRMLANLLGGTYAVIEPLPHGGTRIVLSKKPFGFSGATAAGRHAFVWIPGIRTFESHPFTIASADSASAEFVVNSYDGFTRDLHTHAVQNPGARLRVAVDGPYGTMPDPLAFDKVVLIAGGSGATFTFGLAARMLNGMGAEAQKEIVFIWAVKTQANLSWFADHLQALKAHPHSPKIITTLHITSQSASSTSTEALNRRRSINDGEKAPTGASTPATSPTQQRTTPGLDPEKDAALDHALSQSSLDSSSNSHGHPVQLGRPDITALIRDAVATTPANGRVLVAACGPQELMGVVRDVTAGLIGGAGAGVELHCEQFGW